MKSAAAHHCHLMASPVPTPALGAAEGRRTTFLRCLREQGVLGSAGSLCPAKKVEPPPLDEGVRGASLQAGLFAHQVTAAMLLATAPSCLAVEAGARALSGGAALYPPNRFYPALFHPSADQAGWALLGLQEAAGGVSAAAPGAQRAAVAQAVGAARRVGGSGAPPIPCAAVGWAVPLP